MRIPIAKDAWRFFIPLIILSITAFFINWNITGIILFILSFAVIGFFRDPRRTPPNIADSVISAADGKISHIETVKNSKFPRGEAIRISTFLSVFNVHINRSPISGEIKYIKHTAGKFLNALKEKSAFENQNNEIHIFDGKNIIIVKQISGAIARRVICSKNEGDYVEKGERIGLIRFGSRTDVFVPTDTDIRVKVGSKVIGGKTVLGILQNNKES